MNRPHRRPARGAFLALIVGGFPILTPAITDEDIFKNSRFNFSNPGARALAMGGAFIAIANDATAAQANPARLAVLAKPEVFIEFRDRRPADAGTSTGRLLTDPSANPAASLDVVSSIEQQKQTGPSVVSFVWPFKTRRPFTLGVSRQEIVSIGSMTSNGVLEVPIGASPFQDPFDPEIVSSTSVGDIDETLVLYALSGGYQVSRRFYVGGSVVYGRLNVDSSVVSLFSDPDSLTGLGDIDPLFEEPQGAPIISTSIHDAGTDVKWSLGVFWALNDRLSLGAIHKKGVHMSLREEVLDRSAPPYVPGVDPVTGAGTIATLFNVPDVTGIGLSYQPFAGSSNTRAQGLTFALDVLRVEYHDLVAGLQPQLNVVTLNDFIQNIEFTADNTTEVHVGAEYYFDVGRATLALRGGAYTDPDNSIHAAKVGADTGVAGFRQTITKGNAFPRRSNVTHVTGGFGFAYAGVEFTGAVDISDIEDQGLFSVIWRFR